MQGSNTDNMVVAAVGDNMQKAAHSQISAAAKYGVTLDVKTTVYINDGSKTWPSTLATVLCEKPELAKGNRQDMADLVTKSLALSKPFDVTRLSKKLSIKAAGVAMIILKRFGYAPTKLERGMDIRDTVAAGNVVVNHTESTIQTRFEADGVWLASKWYAYERTMSYATDCPWYCLGIRFAGYITPLSTVLAMRSIGIGQFIGLDEVARNTAPQEQLDRRNRLLQS